VPLATQSRWWGDELAFQAFGVREQLARDFPGTLAVLRDSGFSRVELASFQGWRNHPYGSFGALANLSGEQVAMVLRRAGLTCRSSHVVSAELEAARLSATLGWMRPIGVHTLVLAGIDAGNGRVAVMRSFERLNDIGRNLRREGMQFMVHSEPLFWRRFGDVMMFDEFFRTVDPALCSLQFDMGSALQMGVDPVEIIAKAPQHVRSLHLRDGKPPFDPARYVPAVALGEGAAQVRKTVEAALQHRIDDFVLEMVMMPGGGEVEALRSSYLYLRNLLPGRTR
jgi:sugar phosphate isomerase/epimerase